MNNIFKVQEKILNKKFDNREDLIEEIEKYLKESEKIDATNIPKDLLSVLIENNNKIISLATKEKANILKSIKHINISKSKSNRYKNI